MSYSGKKTLYLTGGTNQLSTLANDGDVGDQSGARPAVGCRDTNLSVTAARVFFGAALSLIFSQQ
jgi:hypothetical protein